MNALHVLPPVRRFLSQAGAGLWRAVFAGPDEPPPPLRRFGRAGDWIVWVLLLLLLPAAVIVLMVSGSLSLIMGGAWWPLVMVLSLALLALAAFRPLLAWRIAWLALCYELLVGGQDFDAWIFPPLFVSEVQLLAFLMVLFLAAASQPPPVVAWVWALTAGLVWITPTAWSPDLAMVFGRLLPLLHDTEWYLLRELSYSDPGGPTGFQLASMGVVAGVTLLGQLARRSSRTRAELAEAQEGNLVLAERARIARELHDVVAHHMSMVTVRAETAPYRLEPASVSAAAADEFRQISQESRAAMAEMRRLLGVLRSDETVSPPTAPQPGLSDLAELVEPVRAAGAQVSVEMHGALSGLSPAVDLCGYRIVQEALSNSARHAVGAPIRIVLKRTGDELMVAVRNGPAGQSADAGRAGAGARVSGEMGHGVRGMRERVALLGGTLRAGPTGEGGYEVVATLPLTRPVGEPA